MITTATAQKFSPGDYVKVPDGKGRVISASSVAVKVAYLGTSVRRVWAIADCTPENQFKGEKT